MLNLRQLATPEPATRPQPVSVLIPARNEEANIGAAVSAVLANTGVAFELIVLDDGSTDRTAAILAGIDDPRLRVIGGPPLPAGWSGKQHACAVLAQAARHDLLVFTDADVRLAPDALVRMAGFMERNPVALASGFPRQVVHTWSEQLLLPLIHFLLLGFLPISVMRRSPSAALGAGCGQLFIARRAAYAQVGGHAAIRASLHDGLTLPRAFRRAGHMTDLFDATDIATCRMYGSASELWAGLGKNATEGMAKPVALPVWTAMLFGGQILPAILMLTVPSTPAMAALVLGVGLRLVLAARFRQPELSAMLHPLGIVALLVVQWAALLRMLRGRPATWRGRIYPAAIVAAVMLLGAQARAEPGAVEVTVSGVRSNAGHVLVALCDRATFLQASCRYRGRIPASPGSVTVRIAGVPPGIYAAQAFHDENDNGKIDRNFLGLPREGLGFSNDAPMRFGPPAFDDAAFSLGPSGGAIAFGLRYFD